MNRDPGEAIKRQLRKQVGFGCPIPDCANPYLQYHHFDPEWEIEHHHRVDGMIPLCAIHHAKASAWSPKQLRYFKSQAIKRAKGIQGKFEWMKRDILSLIGGNFYYEIPVMVAYKKQPVIWFKRDSDGYLLLSLKMLTASGEARTELINNDWIIVGNPIDVKSPPKGHVLEVLYKNKDKVKIKFIEIKDLNSFVEKYKIKVIETFRNMHFPLLVVEITMKVGGTSINFTPTYTKIGNAKITGMGLFTNFSSGIGLNIE